MLIQILTRLEKFYSYSDSSHVLELKSDFFFENFSFGIEFCEKTHNCLT